MDEPACPGRRELLKQVAELTAWVAELTGKLDAAPASVNRLLPRPLLFGR
jgi:hypothetical protein